MITMVGPAGVGDGVDTNARLVARHLDRRCARYPSYHAEHAGAGHVLAANIWRSMRRAMARASLTNLKFNHYAAADAMIAAEIASFHVEALRCICTTQRGKVVYHNFLILQEAQRAYALS
jgi:hypothetical protein